MATTGGLPLGEFVDVLAPYRNAMIQQASEVGVGMAADLMGVAFAQAVQGATARTSKQLLEIARVFDEGVSPARMQEIHQSVGERAQRAVVRSYRANRSGQTRGASGYRTSGPWERYAGGKLLAALSDDDFFTATPYGLEFVNVAMLNDRAAQWARLNFGALPRGRGSRRTFRVEFSNLVVATIGFNEGPRPGFGMPKGYFWRDGRPVAPQSPLSSPGAEFYLAGTGPRKGRSRVRGVDAEGEPFNALVGPKRMTRGIEARNFLDAGLAVIARETPQRYLAEINDMFKRGESAVRPANVQIRVRTQASFRRSSTSGLF